MSAAAEQVVEQFNEIVKPDGGSVTLVSASDGVLLVRYAPGTNEECETCVMEPDALAGMMRDMVITLDPSITDVKIENNPQPETTR
jgi:Fe-S cluster biogenesis protein NfuA